MCETPLPLPQLFRTNSLKIHQKCAFCLLFLSLECPFLHFGRLPRKRRGFAARNATADGSWVLTARSQFSQTRVGQKTVDLSGCRLLHPGFHRSGTLDRYRRQETGRMIHSSVVLRLVCMFHRYEL